MAIYLGKPTSANLVSGMSVGAPTIIKDATPHPDKYYAYYIVYDRELADYRYDLIQEINAGDVITLKEGEDVAENYVGTEDENPALTFQEWSCPLQQVNGTITIPSRVDCDLYIGAVYVTTDGLTHWINNKYGYGVRVYYGSSSSNLPYAAYEQYYKVMVLSKSVNYNYRMLLYSKELKTLILPSGRTGINDLFSTGGHNGVRALVVPYGVTTIQGNCMGNLQSLEHLWLPDSVTSITGGLFQGSAIRHYHIPSNLEGTLIQHTMYDNRVFIKKLVLDCKITAMAAYAIRSTRIGTLYLPSTMATMPSACFNNSRVYVLVCNATTPPTYADSSINSYLLRCYVPVGTISAYESADGWSAYAGKYYEYTQDNCDANGDEYIELQ